MVDRIKFYLICSLSDSILKQKQKHSYIKNGKEFYVFDFSKISFLSNSENDSKDETGYIIEFQDNESDNSFSNYSYKNLVIIFCRDVGKTIGRLTIQQNLRKNYIRYKNKSPFHDLMYSQFVEIINLYADEFEIPRELFWKSTITQIELGVNLRFRMNISGVINSFSQIKRVQKRFLVDNSALYFKARKFEIIAYDKLSRVSEQKEIFPNHNKTRRKKMIEKISKNNSFLRFELRIKSVKQFNKRGFKGKIESLEKLRLNFKEISDSFYYLAKDISFVDVISPEISQKLVRSQLKSKGKKEFDDYLIYLGLRKYGVVEFINFASPLLNSGIKLSYLRSLETLFNSYKLNNSYMQITFFNKLRKRLDLLSEVSFKSNSII